MLYNLKFYTLLIMYACRLIYNFCLVCPFIINNKNIKQFRTQSFNSAKCNKYIQYVYNSTQCENYTLYSILINTKLILKFLLRTEYF